MLTAVAASPAHTVFRSGNLEHWGFEFRRSSGQGVELERVVFECPCGERVVGGGSILTSYNQVDEVIVTSSWPSDSDTWSTSAQADSYWGAGDWSIQAFAIGVTAS